MEFVLNLRNVDPSQVLTDYNKGFYNKLDFSDLPNIKGTKITTAGYDKNTDSDVFSFKNREGIEIIIFSTNCKNDGEPRACLWCRKILDDLSLTIPVIHNKVNGDDYYAGSLKCCNFNCALAYTIKEGMYLSEKYIQDIFAKCYGGEVLYKANDYHLLKIFGGPLSYEKFEENPSRYISTGGVTITDCKEFFSKY